MRGTALEDAPWEPLRRFIPAHAGNRQRYPPADHLYSVHPRACGEQTFAASHRSSGNGSSPRMRGTVCAVSSASGWHRFIPAHAGNSLDISIQSSFPPVHPRACGEQPFEKIERKGCYGSSPRMRGTVGNGAHDRAHGRFIPAHAGNRVYLLHGHALSPVHPRACGEQGLFASRACLVSGSSPRMRGTVPIGRI